MGSDLGGTRTALPHRAKTLVNEMTRVLAPHTVANSYAERWIGTVRRELLDRTIILGSGHLRALLSDYLEHYNTHRPHRALRQRAPTSGEVLAYRTGQPIRRHTCGRLINEYRQAA
jgi:putative transposase